MDRLVAVIAQYNQIILIVAARMTTELLVVNLKIRHRATTLTTPTVSAEYLLAHVFVQLGREQNARILWANPVHDAFSSAWATNARCCSAGRNLKQRAIECKSRSGHPLSRLAPAKKSAQIISRQ